MLTFATAAGTGDISLRFEHLRRRAAYPLEALRGLRALRLTAWDLAARVAREVARASIGYTVYACLKRYTHVREHNSDGHERLPVILGVLSVSKRG